jgi:trehalose/maltose hydrolase-like predicted phosphorylase
MRILDGTVQVHPLIPDQWKSYSFRARFRGVLFEVTVTHKEIIIRNISEKRLTVLIYGKSYHIAGSEKRKFEIEKK